MLTDLHAPMCEALSALDQPVVRCSAAQLPFASKCFDGAMSLHVLYHLPEPAEAVAELDRVVGDGGWLALATNGPDHLRELDELAADAGLTLNDTALLVAH